jgi:hypothetical protein
MITVFHIICLKLFKNVTQFWLNQAYLEFAGGMENGAGYGITIPDLDLLFATLLYTIFPYTQPIAILLQLYFEKKKLH